MRLSLGYLALQGSQRRLFTAEGNLRLGHGINLKRKKGLMAFDFWAQVELTNSSCLLQRPPGTRPGGYFFVGG